MSVTSNTRSESTACSSTETTAASPHLAGVVVIIPARNEQASLPLVLRDLPVVDRVVVANNGSTDRTAELAREAGALVVDEPQAGYGAACLAGLAAIESAIESGKLETPQIVAFVDADYSDHVHLMPSLAEPILRGRADLVLGSRLMGEREPGAMPLQSVLGNGLACFLMRWIWGHRYTDLGPFRLIRYDALQRLRMDDRNFGWTIEMQIKAVAAGLRIEEIPVPYRKRIGQSKISGTLSGTIKAGGKILYTIARHAIGPRRKELRRLSEPNSPLPRQLES